MCNVSEQNVKWFVRYRAGRSEFAPFWRKNGSKLAIMNSNFPKLGWTHVTEVTNRWVKFRNKMLNGLWDIVPDRRTDERTNGRMRKPDSTIPPKIFPNHIDFFLYYFNILLIITRYWITFYIPFVSPFLMLILLCGLVRVELELVFI